MLKDEQNRTYNGGGVSRPWNMVRLFILTVNENYNDCHQWKRMRTFLYIPKAKILWSVFIIQKSRHFAKSKTISITCLFTKCRTLYDTRFSWNFWISRLFTRSMTLCVTWRFLYFKKRFTSKKSRQFSIYFYIQKSGHFALRDFLLNLWNWRRGGEIFISKK